MSDHEGWGVETRRATIALAGFVAALLALVGGGGLIYRATIMERTRPHPGAFPAPRLETIDTAPGDARQVPPPAPPADIDRAMAAVVARGDALWSGR